MVNEKAVLTIFPVLHSVDLEMLIPADGEWESEHFSEDKPGDDPSEVFDIREYEDGDRIRNIHWKLTSKRDEFMVKEYSLPLGHFGAVILDSKMFLNTAEALLETALAVSHWMMQQKSPFYLIWQDGDTGEYREEWIEEEDRFYGAWSELLNSCCGKDTGDFSKYWNHEAYASIYYITSQLNDVQSVPDHVTIFQILNESEDEVIDCRETQTVVSVYISDVKGSLENLTRLEERI